MSQARLLPSLFLELCQSEQVAYAAPVRAARLLGHVPPATAMRAIAAHANETLDALPRLAAERSLPTRSLGSLLGEAVATLHRAATARVGGVERSYRCALLDVRRGVDLVHLLRCAANDEDDDALVAFLDEWLPTREWLVRQAADELDWFSRHPESAARRLPRLHLATPASLSWAPVSRRPARAV